jgi:hypothetical protein
VRVEKRVNRRRRHGELGLSAWRLVKRKMTAPIQMVAPREETSKAPGIDDVQTLSRALEPLAAA